MLASLSELKHREVLEERFASWPPPRRTAVATGVCNTGFDLFDKSIPCRSFPEQILTVKAPLRQLFRVHSIRPEIRIPPSLYAIGQRELHTVNPFVRTFLPLQTFEIPHTSLQTFRLLGCKCIIVLDFRPS